MMQSGRWHLPLHVSDQNVIRRQSGKVFTVLRWSARPAFLPTSANTALRISRRLRLNWSMTSTKPKTPLVKSFSLPVTGRNLNDKHVNLRRRVCKTEVISVAQQMARSNIAIAG